MNLNFKEKSKQNPISNNKGITLIALVITIIVMLILVAVTISMAVNGGLFNYAGRAARETEAEKNKEIRWANVQENLSTDQLIDYYTKEEPVIKTFTWTGMNGEETPVEYQFEQGMTWEEWINSSYNPYEVDEDHFHITIYGHPSDAMCFDAYFIYGYWDEDSGEEPNCRAGSEISPNAYYAYLSIMD